MAVKRQKRGAVTGLRCHYTAYVGSFRHCRRLRCDIFPGLAAVARDLHVAIIGSNPKYIGSPRRFAQRGDGRILLHAIVAGESVLVRRLAENLQFVAVSTGRQVSAEPGPVVSSIRRLEEIISTVVDRSMFVDGNRHGRVPLEAIVRLSDFGFRPDRPLLSGAHVAAIDVTVLRFGVDDPRLHVVYGRIKSVPTVNHLPIFIHDAVASKRLAWPAPTAVVLQAAADVVGLFIVERHFVKLPDGDGVDEVPGLPGIVAPVNAAIGPGEHLMRIAWVNPHRVIVSVNAMDALR